MDVATWEDWKDKRFANGYNSMSIRWARIEVASGLRGLGRSTLYQYCMSRSHLKCWSFSTDISSTESSSNLPGEIGRKLKMRNCCVNEWQVICECTKPQGGRHRLVNRCEACFLWSYSNISSLESKTCQCQAPPLDEYFRWLRIDRYAKSDLTRAQRSLRMQDW